MIIQVFKYTGQGQLQGGPRDQRPFRPVFQTNCTFLIQNIVLNYRLSDIIDTCRYLLSLLWSENKLHFTRPWLDPWTDHRLQVVWNGTFEGYRSQEKFAGNVLEKKTKFKFSFKLSKPYEFVYIFFCAKIICLWKKNEPSAPTNNYYLHTRKRTVSSDRFGETYVYVHCTTSN